MLRKQRLEAEARSGSSDDAWIAAQPECTAPGDASAGGWRASAQRPATAGLDRKPSGFGVAQPERENAWEAPRPRAVPLAAPPQAAASSELQAGVARVQRAAEARVAAERKEAAAQIARAAKQHALHRQRQQLERASMHVDAAAGAVVNASPGGRDGGVLARARGLLARPQYGAGGR